MKWALAQLYRYNKQPFSFSVDYDFHDRIADIDDILDISTIKVTGTGQNVYDDRYIFNFHIEGMMTLECARTLDPVPFPINLDTEEVFDTVDDGECNVIEKNTIDIDDVIWETIYLEKPMRVFKEGTTPYEDDVHEFDALYDAQINDKLK